MKGSDDSCDSIQEMVVPAARDLWKLKLSGYSTQSEEENEELKVGVGVRTRRAVRENSQNKVVVTAFDQNLAEMARQRLNKINQELLGNEIYVIDNQPFQYPDTPNLDKPIKHCRIGSLYQSTIPPLCNEPHRPTQPLHLQDRFLNPTKHSPHQLNQFMNHFIQLFNRSDQQMLFKILRDYQPHKQQVSFPFYMKMYKEYYQRKMGEGLRRKAPKAFQMKV